MDLSILWARAHSFEIGPVFQSLDTGGAENSNHSNKQIYYEQTGDIMISDSATGLEPQDITCGFLRLS